MLLVVKMIGRVVGISVMQRRLSTPVVPPREPENLTSRVQMLRQLIDLCAEVQRLRDRVGALESTACRIGSKQIARTINPSSRLGARRFLTQRKNND